MSARRSGYGSAAGARSSHRLCSAGNGGDNTVSREAWVRQLQVEQDRRIRAAADETAQATAEAARKATQIINHKVLREERHQSERVLRCFGTLHRLFSEAAAHMDDPGTRYHQVRAQSRTLSRDVLDVAGGEDLLLLARWLPRVREHEKFYAFDAAVRHNEGILKAVDGCVTKAMKLLQEKEGRRQAEVAEARARTAGGCGASSGKGGGIPAVVRSPQWLDRHYDTRDVGIGPGALQPGKAART
eukprot:jgi/Tetstr1/426618/TSEL_016895.t1